MGKIQKAALVAAAIGLTTSVSVAQAVPISVYSSAFSPNGGYGQDRCEKCGATLDTRFSNTGFSAQTFSLYAAGDSRDFVFGTVDFEEPEAYGGINHNETDNLGVKAFLGFSAGGNSSLLKFNGIGKAYTGGISDAAVDYTLSWQSRQIHFGKKGLLEISFSDLAFSGIGPKTLMATVTILHSDNVPEPGTVALFGLGLAGLGLVRRRKSG